MVRIANTASNRHDMEDWPARTGSNPVNRAARVARSARRAAHERWVAHFGPPFMYREPTVELSPSRNQFTVSNIGSFDDLEVDAESLEYKILDAGPMSYRVMYAATSVHPVVLRVRGRELTRFMVRDEFGARFAAIEPALVEMSDDELTAKVIELNEKYSSAMTVAEVEKLDGELRSLQQAVKLGHFTFMLLVPTYEHRVKRIFKVAKTEEDIRVGGKALLTLRDLELKEKLVDNMNEAA
eukprot:218831_1